MTLGPIDVLRRASREHAIARRSSLTEAAQVIHYSGRWPGARIPYEFDINVSNQTRIIVEDAMRAIENSPTIVRFQPRNGESQYLRIQNGPKRSDTDPGCYSHVGVGSPAVLSLLESNPGCITQPTAIHELGHAIGLEHEHQRANRDESIFSLVQGNGNFTTLNQRHIGLYAFRSIMGYSSLNFAEENQGYGTVFSRLSYDQWSFASTTLQPTMSVLNHQPLYFRPEDVEWCDFQGCVSAPNYQFYVSNGQRIPITSVKSVDWNNDGRNDLLSCYEGYPIISHDSNTPWIRTVGSCPHGIAGLLVGDMNGGGLPDLVWKSGNTWQLYLREHGAYRGPGPNLTESNMTQFHAIDENGRDVPGGVSFVKPSSTVAVRHVRLASNGQGLTIAPSSSVNLLGRALKVADVDGVVGDDLVYIEGNTLFSVRNGRTPVTQIAVLDTSDISRVFFGHFDDNGAGTRQDIITFPVGQNLPPYIRRNALGAPQPLGTDLHGVGLAYPPPHLLNVGRTLSGVARPDVLMSPGFISWSSFDTGDRAAVNLLYDGNDQALPGGFFPNTSSIVVDSSNTTMTFGVSEIASDPIVGIRWRIHSPAWIAPDLRDRAIITNPDCSTWSTLGQFTAQCHQQGYPIDSNYRRAVRNANSQAREGVFRFQFSRSGEYTIDAVAYTGWDSITNQPLILGQMKSWTVLVRPRLWFSNVVPSVDPGFCVQLAEPNDPHSWHDNYLCAENAADKPLWSNSGPIPNMRCTQVGEPIDPNGWDNNYLCVPNSYPITLQWSSWGPIAGLTCTQWYEGSDPQGWYNNYLCW